MEKEGIFSRQAVFIIIILLILQTGLILFYGSRKAGFHEDEIYMFEFANNPTTYIRNAKDYYETWKSGDFYRNAVVPGAENKYNYEHIFRNNEIEMAQIYLSILHTVSIVFSKIDLKWIGLIPNLFFGLVSTILLYCLTTVLFNKKLAYIVAFAWTINIGMLTSIMLIRPYAFMTMLVLLFIYLHVLEFYRLCFQNTKNIKILLLLSLCTFLGISTHYYFFIFCFFICGAFSLSILVLKQYKYLMQYILAEFGALGCFIFMFPQSQILSSSLSKKSIQNVSVEYDWKVIKSILSVISKNVWGGLVFEFTIIIATISIICLLKNHICFSAIYKPEKGVQVQIKYKNVEWNITYNYIIILIVTMTVVGYILIIARISIWKEDRYYYCLYPLILLIICAALYLLIQRIIKDKTQVIALLFCAVCAVSLVNYGTNDVNYLYQDFLKRQEILKEYNNYPIIIMSKYPTKPERFIPEYVKHQYVYRCKNGHYDGIKLAAETVDLTKGFLLYVFDYEDTDEELFAEISKDYFVCDFDLLDKKGGNRTFFAI